MMDYEGNKQYFPPLIELSGALALFGDDAYFQHTKAKYLEYSSLHHTLQNTMFDDPMISFEEAYTQFYDSNQPLLKLSRKDNINEDNSAVQFLLQQFLRVAIHGSNAEKQVVKSFFLGRKDNKDLRGLQGANSSLSYNTPYIKFFLEQSHQGVSFELFTLDDFIKLTNKVTGIHFYHYEIPPEQFIKIFKLGFERLTLPCVKQMIPLVNKMMSSSQIPRIIQSHLDQYGPYALFSDEATEICLFMNRHLSHPYHTKVRKELLGQLSLPNPFVISQLPDIDVSKGIILYRTLDMNLYFPSPEIQKEFGKWISQKIKLIENIDDKIRALEQVLFVGDKLLTMPLSDLPLRNELVKLWVESIVRKYGIDPLTSQYDETMKPIIAKVYENSAKRDTSYILNLLANAIESQQKLSDYMGLLLEPEKYLEQNKRQNKLISHGVTTLAALSSYLGKDRQDQLTLLNFLSAPLTPAALHDFASYLKNKGKEKKVAEIMGYNPGINDMEIHSVDHVSQLVYYQFWDRNLTERAVIINYLLLPPETVVSEQIQKQAYSDAYDYVAHQLFPLAMDPASDDHAAVAFLKAYLETADNYDRSYLLAGMLVTSSESQGENKGVGKKLALLCEHMGPAYVKLAQAIHSHPQTPGHLRKDLDHIKGRANPPTRWQLWRMIADTMPIKDRDNIARLKVLLGSASYNMALQVTLKDDKQAVLLLLREHAEKEAKAGFHHLSSAIKVCQHEKVSSLRGSMLGMIHEASELSATELSQACGDKQSDIAQCIYHLSMLIALKDNDYYQITMHPSKTLSSGNGYRFTELVRGTEFNDLPKTTEHEKDIRRLVAKAVVAAELTNILSGSFFDCDRHGNQLRVVVDEENHSVAIGLYDFGELALQEATPYELQQLKEVLIDFPKAVIKNSSFDAVFSQHIDAAIKLGKDTHYLMRIRKALLALHDFLQELSANDLLEAMQAVTRSSKLSLDLKQDFCRSVILIEGLQSLHQKTKQVATTVSAIKSGLSLFVTQATNKVKSVAQTLDFSPNMDDWF